MFLNDTDRYDQHFLVDRNVIIKLIETSNLKKSDIVVEIGPGTGEITKLLSNKAKKIICFELDKRLKPFLDEIIEENNNIEVIYDSILNTQIPKCNKVVTSLPYSIIEPLIYKFIDNKIPEIIMITGKKYAFGVLNNKLNKLNLITNCFYIIDYIMDIPPKSFNPSPRVMSSLISLKFVNEEEIKDFNLLMFRKMYYLDNKKVKNALVESFIQVMKLKRINITKRISKNILKEINIEENLGNKVFKTCSNEDIVKINEIINNIDILSREL